MGGFFDRRLRLVIKKPYNNGSHHWRKERVLMKKQIFHEIPFMRALAPLMLAVFPIASFADDDDGATVYLSLIHI